ncbi:MAG: tetratricopeptide repeat protein [Pseudobdellovibrionaceae bacterium]
MFLFIAIAIVITVVFLLFGKSSLNDNKQASTITVNNLAVGHEEKSHQSAITPSSDEIINKSSSGKNIPNEPPTMITLTSGNFESFVLKCFQGEKCELGENPLEMYQVFKGANNHRANDSLISFMRSKLKDKEFRDQYKDMLKQMIYDFYPREEKQFQEAAYYNYLGDLQKSLDTYLDLQKKSQTDPSLRPAPTLNIANILYDMHRFKDALPYYEAALEECLSRSDKPIPNPESFIEERIAEIKNKLRAR